MKFDPKSKSLDNKNNFSTKPISAFSVNINKGYIPFTLHFKNNSIYDPKDLTHFLWDFGDGEVSKEKDPNHTYEKEGIYSVSLKVNNINGENIFYRKNFIIAEEKKIKKIYPILEEFLDDRFNFHIKSNISFPKGKFYIEVENKNISENNKFIGIINKNVEIRNLLNYDIFNSLLYGSKGYKLGNSFISKFGKPFGNNEIGNDIIGICIDNISKNLWFSLNGSWLNGGNPEKNILPAFKLKDNIEYCFYAIIGENDYFDINFGNKKFKYFSPKGYQDGFYIEESN